MKRIIFIIVWLGFIYNNAQAQNVAINESGNAPNSNAILDVNPDNNHDKGILLPRLTTSERTGMSLGTGDAGLTVYDTDTKSYWWWDGTAWVEVGVDNRYWKLTGNSGTTPGTDFLGTTDSKDLVIKTYNSERIRITSGGNVGIGTTSPSTLLHVNGSMRLTGAFFDANNNAGSSGQVLTSTGSGTQWSKFKQNNSANITSTGWYRIASNSGNRADAKFTLRDFISGGGHSTVRFYAGVNYGDADGISFTLLDHSKYSNVTFTKVRIIENGTYDGAYLEVYVNRTGNVEYTIWDNEQHDGWTPVDWTSGSVPSGWTSHEYDIDKLFAVGGNSEYTVVNRNGRVGIGTSSPSSKLEIYGNQQNIEISNTTETDAGIIFNDAQATGSQYAKITYGSGDNDLNFLNASSTPRMVIKSSGRIGIGTTNPLDLFSVGSSSQFRVNSGGDVTRIRNIPYHWPTSQGDANSMLVNDGSGNLSWVKSGWSAIAVIDLNNATSYTVSGLDGNAEINYKIILMGQQETNGGNSAFCILRPNGDNNSSNYSYSMDVWWRYIDGSGGAWTYDAYNTSGILLYVADGNFNPNYLEIETILSAFTGNRRHAVTRYSLQGNSKDIVVNHSAGVWLNTTSNITSLEFNWSDPFTGKLIIYATH